MRRLPVPLMGRNNVYGASFGGAANTARGADFTGIADSKTFTISLWAKFTGGDSANQAILNSNQTLTSNRFGMLRTSTNFIGLRGRNSAGTVILSKNSAVTIVADGMWHHIAGCADLGASLCEIFLDGVDITAAGGTLTNDTIDFTTGNVFIGVDNAAANFLNADIAEFWFDTSYIDISTNLRKFYRHRKPAPLGYAGQAVTGSPPIAYFKGPASRFIENRGSGGDCTVTGTLTDPWINPSE